MYIYTPNNAPLRVERKHWNARMDYTTSLLNKFAQKNGKLESN